MPALLEKSADLQKKVDDVLDMWKQQEEEAPASTDSNLYARPENNQSVSVTVGDLRVLAAKAGIPVPEPRADKECGATFNTCFYLRKAGVRLNSTTRHCKFVCLTDGYSCCFLLQKKIKKKMAGTTLTPSKMKKKVQG
ncbi:hypothetical protein V8B55DRAFT_1415239 [Mucor lusitanicus]|uniref:Uncharacterized protein n=1 Tax=Mucor lusitanicus CBS 277.49 TaxID=747725 RepID=A0A168ITB9_MUCCL|nr:hypothetical protein MUCCIDRAFT_85743 [Mucor lusitanicus CBS 277.49]